MSKAFNASFPTDEARRAYYRDAMRRWRAQPDNREKSRKASWTWHQYNKERQAEYRKLYRTKTMTPERESAYHRKALYGLKPLAFEVMLLAQCGQCAICGIVMERPHIDHDHETGEIRGLLCTNCNTGIGNLRDSKELLVRALDYLAA